ncbi:transporter substrate-binding domain-containing protein [Candidatus Babeliales bacterium]|nr:transporter substrate-binding domain-containing protein [Candidatus Babeliales bacterium]
MNSMTKVMIFSALLVSASLLFFMTKKRRSIQTIQTDTHILKVGTADDFPPFCFNKDGKIVGFDIDVAQSVATLLKKEMELINMDFDVLLLELQSGSIDMLAAGLTSTEEKKKKVFFTEPYLEGDPLVTLQIKKETTIPLNSLDSLKNKKVVVNAGYTADSYVSQAGIDPLRVATVAEALLALQSERVDLFVSAQAPLLPLFKKFPKENFVMTPLIGTEENCALALTKQKPELFKEVEQAIRTLKENGTIAALKKKWEL